jgi:hypothetical protein
MKNKSLFILLFSFLIFQSCKDKQEKIIQGLWSIDCIHYQDDDFRYCLYLNLVKFEKNGECNLPSVRCIEFRNGRNEFGNWELIKNDKTISLVIKSNNEIFNNNYEISFYKDEVNKLLKMNLISEDLNIWMSKGLFDFDNNIDLINHLTNGKFFSNCKDSYRKEKYPLKLPGQHPATPETKANKTLRCTESY